MPDSVTKPPRPRRRNGDNEADFWERLGISGAAERIAGPVTRREKWIDFGKTMLWVVPLTALIWIWAEREQIAYSTISSVPIRIEHASPDRMVTIQDPRPPRISIDVRGPRAGIEALRDRLSEGNSEVVITLSDPTLYKGEVYSLGDMIARNELFTSNAVDVLKTLPAVTVNVEEKASRVVPVMVRPEDATIGKFEFEPKTVTIEGSKKVIDSLTPSQAVVYANVDKFAGKTVGQHEDTVEVMSDEPGLSPRVATIKARVTIERLDEKVVPSVPLAIVVPAWMLEGPTATERVSIDPALTLPNVTIAGPPDAVNSVMSNEYKASVIISLTSEQWTELRRVAKDQGTSEMEVTLAAENFKMPPSVTVINPGQHRVKVRLNRGL